MNARVRKKRRYQSASGVLHKDGMMQVMPATGNDLKVGDITEVEPNIHAGRVASERIGRETVTYVSNIYKYYVAYRLAVGQIERRAAAKAQLKTR